MPKRRTHLRFIDFSNRHGAKRYLRDDPEAAEPLFVILIDSFCYPSISKSIPRYFTVFHTLSGIPWKYHEIRISLEIRG